MSAVRMRMTSLADMVDLSNAPSRRSKPYAHWAWRVGAFLLDVLLFFPAYMVVAVAAPITVDAEATETTHDMAVVALLGSYVLIVGFAVWNFILRQGRTGQTLGKKWVGIRLISEETGRPLGAWLTFGRNLLHVLDNLACYIGYLWPLWDAKRQTFADKIVKSVVVRQ